MSNPTVPIKVDKNVEGGYVSIDLADQIIANFETSKLKVIDDIICPEIKGINDHNIVSSPNDSVCAMTASYNGSNSAYWNVVRRVMVNRGYDKSLTATTGDELGIFALKKNTFDIGVLSGSLTATATGLNFSGNSIADEYYSDEDGNLVRSSNGDKLGTVFLDEGLLVVTSSDYREIATSITSVSFKTRMQHTNFNVFCKCQPNELNFTLNHTAASTASLSSSSLAQGFDNLYTKSSLTSETNSFTIWENLTLSGYDFSPLITSVGLYNDDNELLAIAKLTKPLKKPTDLPITLRVSIDI